MDLTNEDYEITGICYDGDDEELVYVNFTIRKPSSGIQKILDDTKRCSVSDCPHMINDKSLRCSVKKCENMVCEGCSVYSSEGRCVWCEKVFCDDDAIYCGSCYKMYCVKCINKGCNC